jgi:hypothetical protein
MNLRSSVVLLHVAASLPPAVEQQQQYRAVDNMMYQHPVVLGMQTYASCESSQTKQVIVFRHRF